MLYETDGMDCLDHLGLALKHPSGFLRVIRTRGHISAQTKLLPDFDQMLPLH